MVDAVVFRNEVRRYAELIEPLIDGSLTSAPWPMLLYPAMVKGGWRAELAEGGDEVEAAGSGAPQACSTYAWLMGYRLAYEAMPRDVFSRWEERLRARCEDLERLLEAIEFPAAGFGAAEGAMAADAVWIALALHVAGVIFVRDAWKDLASDTFGKVALGQQASGAFLRSSVSDGIEMRGYHELVILHAAGSYAVQARDRALSVAVARAADFHLQTMQPDHATSEPWAVFPLIWHAPARPVADQMLHAATAQHPGAQRGLPAFLLADALYCLRLFL